MEKQSRPKLVGRQRAVLIRMLDAHCTAGDNNRAIYEDGWNDLRILAEVQPLNPNPERPYTQTLIGGERLRSFGHVRINKPKKASDRELVNTKISILFARLTTVEREYAELRKDHNELVDYHNGLATWARDISERRGYTPPPGRPQSTPPMGDDNDNGNGRLV